MAKLFVIAGHGAGDSGACAHGYTEAERVRALASRIKALGGSNVKVGDTSRNYYADNGISSLNISKDYCIIELHMDSASASARGGHVIIKSGFEADKYDKALASFIKTMFPGRANTIVKRSDLANPKRAAAKGYNYRLLECCFISNKDDLNKFNSNIDDLARGILEAFDIKAGSGSSSTTSKPSTSTSGKKSVSAIADEVIAGKWGNGNDRKKKLEAAGYNYNAVQAKVNEKLGVKSGSSSVNIDKLAQDVIAGKYGNGDARKKALGSNYSAVQKRVNEILGASGGSSKKSIDTIAREVIRGDWGNGADRKKRLTAAGYDYNAVQKRVNQLL